jgi:hypothetical protein
MPMSDLDKLTAALRKLQVDRNEWRARLTSYELSKQFYPRRMILRRMILHYQRMLQETEQQIERVKARIESLPTRRIQLDRTKYNDSDLLIQERDWCVAYAAFNHLIMQGVAISEEKARADSVHFMESSELFYRGAFDLQVAFDIFTEYGFREVIYLASDAGFLPPPSKSKFQIQRRAKQYKPHEGDFQGAALRKLIRKLKHEKRPIYVLVSTGFNGDPNSNHAMNVVGALFDTNNELAYIIICTNWGKSYSDDGYRIISVSAFLQDWHRYGYFMMMAA